MKDPINPILRSDLSHETGDIVVIFTKNQAIMQRALNCSIARQHGTNVISGKSKDIRTAILGLGDTQVLSIKWYIVPERDFNEENVKFSETRTMIFEFQENEVRLWNVPDQRFNSPLINIGGVGLQLRMDYIRKQTGVSDAWKQ